MAQHPAANEVTKHLSGMHFPAKRQELEQHASSHGAGDDVLQAIRDLPQDEYGNMADVMKAFGQED
jgi:hypothetical protein